MKLRKKRKTKIAAIIVASFFIIIIGGFYIYTLDYYRADSNIAITLQDETMKIQDETMKIQEQGNMTVFYPDKQLETKTGFIFYPGGKVEATAYVPLLKKISQNGIMCILIKMPLNLAIFNVNGANKVYDEFLEINNWYLGGHSLGGAMASSYVKNNSDKLEGLVLLGAYPINDSNLPTLAIYGSEDIKLDTSKLDRIKNKLELIGGNHAYFGDYGEQEGDGVATMTRAEQQAITVKTITEFIRLGQ